MEGFKALSDDELVDDLRMQVREERKITAQVIRLLEEIDRRKLYLKMGFGSLIEFCIKELKYSESSAYRRVSAMRVCREVPKVEEKILDGTLSLSVLSQVQTFIRHEEKMQGHRMTSEVKQCLIQELENKSSREVERVLVEKSPQQARQEKVRAITSDKSELRLTLDQTTIENLEMIKSLMSHKNPDSNYSDLIKIMSEIVLDKIDPARKEVKRRKAAPTRNSQLIKSEVSNDGNAPIREIEVNAKLLKTRCTFEDEIASPTERISKIQVRRLVWSKAKGQCCYIDSRSKRRCTSRFQLQVDHIFPKSKGGSDHLSNLQLLCREHNQWKGWSVGR